MKKYSETNSRGSFRFAPLAACGFILAALTGCDEAPAVAKDDADAPEVSVVTIEPSRRAFVRELPGRIAPTRIAEVRARVSGIVIERAFNQGSDVKARDVLYRIDPAPFLVELQAAEAAYAKAKAALEYAEQQERRMQSLVAEKAIAVVQYETAVSTTQQARADLLAREADVNRANLNLEYATVRSPISGRVGRALVTEGALVGQGEATHLATVQQLDPIYADFTQSIGELNQLRRDLESGALERIAADTAKVKLVLDDGSIYEKAGKLLFSDATVDPTTGQVTLRGEFPNPKGELLPGMYVRVQIEQGVDDDALSVPQQAVQRNSAGGSEVYVVRDDNRAITRPVRIGRAIEDQWLIMDGLKPGDRVVVEGFQKFTAGNAVKPVVWHRRQRSAEAPSEPQSATAQ
jgi:membrane fusion protein (multidrug efflux system)